jgi:hypothetical protein
MTDLDELGVYEKALVVLFANVLLAGFVFYGLDTAGALRLEEPLQAGLIPEASGSLAGSVLLLAYMVFALASVLAAFGAMVTVVYRRAKPTVLLRQSLRVVAGSSFVANLWINVPLVAGAVAVVVIGYRRATRVRTPARNDV